MFIISCNYNLDACALFYTKLHYEAQNFDDIIIKVINPSL